MAQQRLALLVIWVFRRLLACLVSRMGYADDLSWYSLALGYGAMALGIGNNLVSSTGSPLAISGSDWFGHIGMLTFCCSDCTDDRLVDFVLSAYRHCWWWDLVAFLRFALSRRSGIGDCRIG